jgi:hypothetical protein
VTDNRIQITAGQPETAVFFAARKEVITMPDIGKLKNQQEKVKTEIRQLENRQKILLNRKTDAERKARTRRLIEHGAILESILPAATAMTGEEIKAFLSAISCLPEVVRLLKNKPKSQDMQQP